MRISDWSSDVCSSDRSIGGGIVSDRLASRFAKCRAEGRAALVIFVTGGDPTPTDMAVVLDALVEGGADIIELGMPFTDPMADGPAIQAAHLRSRSEERRVGKEG